MFARGTFESDQRDVSSASSCELWDELCDELCEPEFIEPWLEELCEPEFIEPCLPLESDCVFCVPCTPCAPASSETSEPPVVVVLVPVVVLEPVREPLAPPMEPVDRLLRVESFADPVLDGFAAPALEVVPDVVLCEP